MAAARGSRFERVRLTHRAVEAVVAEEVRVAGRRARERVVDKLERGAVCPAALDQLHRREHSWVVVLLEWRAYDTTYRRTWALTLDESYRLHGLG